MHASLRTAVVFYALLLTIAFVLVVRRLSPPPDLAPAQVEAAGRTLAELVRRTTLGPSPPGFCRQVTFYQGAAPELYEGLAVLAPDVPAAPAAPLPASETHLRFRLTVSPAVLPRSPARKALPLLEARRLDVVSDLVARGSNRRIELAVAVAVDGSVPTAPLRLDNQWGRERRARDAILHRGVAPLQGAVANALGKEDQERLDLLARLLRVRVLAAAGCADAALTLYRDAAPASYRLDIHALTGEVGQESLRLVLEGERQGLPSRARVYALSSSNGLPDGARLLFVAPRGPGSATPTAQDEVGLEVAIEIDLASREPVTVELGPLLAGVAWGGG